MSLFPPVRIAVWAGAIAGLGALARAVTVPVAPAPALEPAVRAQADTGAPRAPSGLDSAARFAASRDLFRRSRRPGPAATAEGLAPSAPSSPKPALRLVGILAGAEPTAVIEGLPGARTARVVRPGDVIGPLTVGRITNAEVRVSGMDTTWVLTLARKS